MHDIRRVRADPASFDHALARRGLPPVADALLALDGKRRHRIHESELALAERNRVAREIGAVRQRGEMETFETMRAAMVEKKSQISALERAAADLDEDLRQRLAELPNEPLEDVPDGVDESANRELRRWGTRREFDFRPAEHFEIGGARHGMDFTTAAKLSGSRFAVLRGGVARIHRALGQFMLDRHVEIDGLTEIWTPVLVREEMMIGTGHLPKFAEDSYRTEAGMWLVPTAEVPLTNIVNGDILAPDALPIRVCAHSQCFRSEAGAAGKDTAGMLRQHQFEKVEMVSITHPDDSTEELERMTRCAEAILEALQLPYRTVVLCTGDMGFAAQRTHDVEVWLPGQGQYREISSVSLCGSFQARRMQARFRDQTGSLDFVHTLNGSGVAVGRALIAVLENGQCEDGSVVLPDILAPYLGGCARLSREGRLQRAPSS